MLAKKNTSIIAFLILSLCIVLVYDYTEYSLRKTNPSEVYSLFNSFSFNSIDNEYYLSYTNNYLKGRGWRFSMYSMQKSDEPVGKGSYFRRVPGYPLLYFVFVSTFGQHMGLQLLIVFQHILFFLTIYCIYQILIFLHFSTIVRNTITLLYAVIPYFYSYCFYTLTESISPFLFIFYIYFLLKAHHAISKKVFYYSLASFFLGYAILTRPYMGIAGILMPYFLYKDFPIRQSLKYTKYYFITFAVVGGMVLSWGIRNYMVTGEFVLLEKAYHPETLDRVKPEFAALWNFVKCWESDGSKMNEIHLSMFYATVNNADTSAKYREKFITKVPKYVLSIINKQEIDEALRAYQKLLLSQKIYYDKNIPMPPAYTTDQLQVAAIFDDFVQRFKAKYSVEYHIYNPIKQLKLMVLHSNTSNIYLFQEPFRHIQVFNFIRYSLVLFHILLYVVMFLNLWWLRTHLKEVLIISITPILLVIFFAFIFQVIEQRYMLPLLPSLFIGLGFFLDKTKLLTSIEYLCKSLILKMNANQSAT